jgi:hypothetical protein
MAVLAPVKESAFLLTRVSVSWAGAVPLVKWIDALFIVHVPPAVEQRVVDGVTLHKPVQPARGLDPIEETALLGFIMAAMWRQWMASRVQSTSLSLTAISRVKKNLPNFPVREAKHIAKVSRYFVRITPNAFNREETTAKPGTKLYAHLETVSSARSDGEEVTALALRAVVAPRQSTLPKGILMVWRS